MVTKIAGSNLFAKVFWTNSDSFWFCDSHFLFTGRFVLPLRQWWWYSLWLELFACAAENVTCMTAPARHAWPGALMTSSTRSVSLEIWEKQYRCMSSDPPCNGASYNMVAFAAIAGMTRPVVKPSKRQTQAPEMQKRKPHICFSRWCSLLRDWQSRFWVSLP